VAAQVIAGSTKRLGGATSAARASRGSPQVSRLAHGRQLESRVREAQGRVILFGAGAGCEPSCGRRFTGCSPAKVPSGSLDDWCPGVINSFYRSGSTMIYRTSAKNSLGVLTHGTLIEHTRGPATGELLPGGSCRSRLKDNPIPCDKVARLRII